MTDTKTPTLGNILTRARILRADLNACRLHVLHDTAPRNAVQHAAMMAEIALVEAAAWLEGVTIGEVPR